MFKSIKILLTGILMIIGSNSFSQVVNLELRKGVFIGFELHGVMSLDQEKYVDFGSGSNKEYFIKVFFGQKKFDVEVYNTKSGLLERADFLFFGEHHFFSKLETDKKLEEYRMSKGGVDYVVSFKELFTLSNGEKEVQIFVSVRDTIKKKYLYIASDIVNI